MRRVELAPKTPLARKTPPEMLSWKVSAQLSVQIGPLSLWERVRVRALGGKRVAPTNNPPGHDPAYSAMAGALEKQRPLFHPQVKPPVHRTLIPQTTITGNVSPDFVGIS